VVLRHKIRGRVWGPTVNAALAVLALVIASVPALARAPSAASTSLVLSRPVRPLEFLSAVGTRAALFGNESGNFEAWAYPLKILRDFHLRVHIDGLIIPAESLARTVSVRPESSTILYASDTFEVRETLFVPVTEPGAVVIIEVETTDPLEIEVVFERDFQLEWPAALGGTYLHWDPNLRAFVLGEELKKYSALVGSPSGVMSETEYSTNYSMSSENAFLLGPSSKGKDTKLVVIAGSTNGQNDAQDNYRKLSSNYAALLRDSADYYREYLNRTVNLVLPDEQLQEAYDWSRISVIQGMVHSPLLGTGLIAGYRTSGTSQRPGFAWFFGRDAMWTSFALNAEGDFPTTRTALEFLTGFQRADGKIPHEIAQSASLVNWFKEYPYGFASADATPLYVIAMNDYVVQSGDAGFASGKWDNLWRAYQFLKSTYNKDGLPRNFGFGHGWVEGGPLLPVETELYQSSLGAEALHALSNIAHVVGKEDVGRQLDQDYAHQKNLVNDKFWSEGKKTFSFALDANQHQVEISSVLATVPLWFDLLQDNRVQPTIDKLADSDHQTDWGMRIISSQSPLYNPGGYHFGSVWPLFTGWASVGEYRYHRPLPAYSNFRSNALLALDGSLGHVTEVLSGDYYEPLSTSSPQQIWSAAMVVSPILKGMFGLEVDAISHRLRFSPHIPADWKSFEIGNVHVGNAVLDLKYRRDAETVTLEVGRNGSGDCTLYFSPAFSPRAEITSTTINGRTVRSLSQTNKEDQHVVTEFPLTMENTVLRMTVRDDFGVSYSSTLPPLGETSHALKIVSEAWAPGNNELTLEIAGIAGKQYDLSVLNPGLISSVDGAELVKNDAGTRLLVKLPDDNSASYVHGRVSIHLAATAARKVSRVQ
jgi:glycogen debranching enzyme